MLVCWLVGCCAAVPLLLQDLIARYDVHDVLPKLRAYSHEWDEEVQVRGAACPGSRCTCMGRGGACQRLGGGRVDRHPTLWGWVESECAVRGRPTRPTSFCRGG